MRERGIVVEDVDGADKPSTAAFMFMPQFNRCFTGFSHIVPVFMRTLAIMFAQARLIPREHPALFYGYRGVPRSSFSDLMASAWMTLRRRRATPYQWLTYLSVVFMCVIVITGMTRAIAAGAFGFGAVAHAQLYTLTGKDTGITLFPDATQGPAPSPPLPAPQLPPYRIDTGAEVMMTQPGPIAADPFDLTVPQPTHEHGDYGIMLLNKVLRQGTYFAGGYLQNAMQGMMAIYNTGVLVIAGVMLFWSIMSVVIDTAKTGIVGGRRHNMVWAPIRIVFALGILMPLSSAPCTTADTVCGFSSGQLMVQKLAEWGSNLGTNVWNEYLTTAIGSAMMAPISIDNATPLMQKYAMMWFCRVLYNGYQFVATSGGTGDMTGPIRADDTVIKKLTFDLAWKTPFYKYSFANKNNPNLCGTVTVPTPIGDASAIAATQSGPTNLSLQAAIQQFKETVYGVWELQFGTGVDHSPDGVSLAGEPYEGWFALFYADFSPDAGLDYYARAWACDMAMHFVTSPTPGPDADGDGFWDVDGVTPYVVSPLVTSGNCDGALLEFPWNPPGMEDEVPGAPLGACTEGGAGSPGVNSPNGPFPWMLVDGNADPVQTVDLPGGAPPTRGPNGPGAALLEDDEIGTNCIEEMTRFYGAHINYVVGKAQAEFMTDFTSILVNSGRGWAGMGEWYIKLTMANSLVDWARHPKVEITPGEIIYTEMPRENPNPRALSAIEQAVMRSTHVALEWWKMQATEAERFIPVSPINSCAGGPSIDQVECPGTMGASLSVNPNLATPSPGTISGDSGQLSLVKNAIGLLGPGTDPMSIIMLLVDFAFGRNPTWALDIVQPGVNNLYPYVSLIKVGQRMLSTGIWLMTAMIGGPMTLEAFVGKGAGVALSVVAGMLAPLVTAFIGAGIFLTYWVPILPFIRVAFAVLTWIVSVFETVIMVPIAALNHINTEGEGLAGQARIAWVMWLNVLLRPSLTVVGFVGGIMVFNGFIVYFNAAFRDTIGMSFARVSSFSDLLLQAFVTVIYVGTMYAVANSSFKLVETIPNALMRYMGGQTDVSFDDHSVTARLIGQASDSVQGVVHGGQKLGAEGAGALARKAEGDGGRSSGFIGH